MRKTALGTGRKSYHKRRRHQRAIQKPLSCISGLTVCQATAWIVLPSAAWKSLQRFPERAMKEQTYPNTKPDPTRCASFASVTGYLRGRQVSPKCETEEDVYRLLVFRTKGHPLPSRTARYQVRRTTSRALQAQGARTPFQLTELLQVWLCSPGKLHLRPSNPPDAAAKARTRMLRCSDIDSGTASYLQNSAKQKFQLPECSEPMRRGRASGSLACGLQQG